MALKCMYVYEENGVKESTRCNWTRMRSRDRPIWKGDGPLDSLKARSFLTNCVNINF
jgi:hypothetical protein